MAEVDRERDLIFKRHGIVPVSEAPPDQIIMDDMRLA